ncbi:hypothetical protein HGG76_25380 [Ochrobactrum tritici]|uniref:Uncharacterized protein n=1 Tax=Brucella tritici TaxID=94626 RepID=A0A7X6FSR3_9HYPH|nr:hypothetical protein [Brucella tritici]
MTRDDHAKSITNKAATRLTGTSPGTFTTRSPLISIVTIPAVAAIVSGVNEVARICGSSAIDNGTNALTFPIRHRQLC